MSFFYQASILHLGEPQRAMNLLEFAQTHPGPFYIYDLDTVKARYQRLKDAFPRHFHLTIHYAMKANSNLQILSTLAKLGAGVDTVSGGEIELALKAGFAPSTIVFSGVGKTRAEIRRALELNIKQINVESPAELRRVAELAKETQHVAQVALRMNPNVNPQTHPYITTGYRENKFGMDESMLTELIAILKTNQDHLALKGLTVHIGSQLMAIDALRESIEKVSVIFRRLQNEGFPLTRLDVGGGLGIDYSSASEDRELDLIDRYAKMITEQTKNLGCEILLEPGRIVVGRSGVLIGQVQYLKFTPHKNFAILDTGMHHLLRPALYGATHRILPLRLRPAEDTPKLRKFDVVGPICESTDVLARDVELALEEDDYLAMADCGAYGYVMASHYNCHELPHEWTVSAGELLPANL